MSKWNIVVDVDEKKLISTDPANDEEQEETIEGHISREMGWVNDSGIYTESITPAPDPEELWDKIQALAQQVFWKEQQRVTDGIALGELKKVLQEYGVVK